MADTKKNIKVAAALITQGDKFLIAKRAVGRHLADFWEFPGGKIEKGETASEACRREILEELNCRVSVDSYFLSCHHEYEDLTVDLDLYICHLLDGEEPQLSDSHSELQFITADEMDNFGFAPADYDFLPKVKDFMKAAERCNQTFEKLKQEQASTAESK